MSTETKEEKKPEMKVIKGGGDSANKAALKTKTPEKEAGEQPTQPAYGEIILNEGEDMKIIITKYSNGNISTVVKTPPDATFNFFEAMGVIESSKQEAIFHNGGHRQQAAPQPQKLVKFKIDEIDVALDTTGQLQKLGLEIGQEIEVTEMEFKMRTMTREQYKITNGLVEESE